MRRMMLCLRTYSYLRLRPVIVRCKSDRLPRCLFSIETPSIPRDTSFMLAPGLAFICQSLKHGVCLRDPPTPLLPSRGISESQRLYCSGVRKLCGMEIYSEWLWHSVVAGKETGCGGRHSPCQETVVLTVAGHRWQFPPLFSLTEKLYSGLATDNNIITFSSFRPFGLLSQPRHVTLELSNDKAVVLEPNSRQKQILGLDWKM